MANPTNKMEKVLGELTSLNKMAGTNLDDVPRATRPGVAIAIAEAQKRLVDIQAEYKELLKTRAFTIFTKGPLANQLEFAKLAELEGEVVVVSAQELYERMAAVVEPTLGAQRQFGGTALNHLIRAVEDIARLSGTGRLTQAPRLRDIAITRTTEEVVAVCREILIHDVGTDLNKDFLEHLAFTAAFETGQTEKVIPIVVINSIDESDFSLQDRMFTGRGFSVEIPDTVDKEFVLGVFKHVISEVSSTKKQQNINQNQKTKE